MKGRGAKGLALAEITSSIEDLELLVIYGRVGSNL